MHLCALTRWNARGLEAELPSLAKEMGLAPYDARLRLAGGLPVVLKKGLDEDAAQRLLMTLRERGHGVVACDPETLPSAEEMVQARSFQLNADTCVWSDERGQTLTLSYADVVALVRAMELSEVEKTIETSEKKFALGRAVMSGGVLLNKTVKKSEASATNEQQEVAYLFARTSPRPVLLKEHDINYAALGSARGASTRQSFDALMARLETSAQGALHDKRMLSHKRKLELKSIRGTTSERLISNSNADANALAAHLLMRAHLEQQL